MRVSSGIRLGDGKPCGDWLGAYATTAEPACAAGKHGPIVGITLARPERVAVSGSMASNFVSRDGM